MDTYKKIVDHYLNFSGERDYLDFGNLMVAINKVKNKYPRDAKEYKILEFLHDKLLGVFPVVLKNKYIIVVVDENSEADIIAEYQRLHGEDLGKLRPPKKKGGKKQDLGKLVDEGKPYKGRADEYWRARLKQVFTPDNSQVRSGATIPKNYDYDNIDFIKAYYGLFAVEFGNWLSQQDRKNYLGGLGLSLFDLSHILNFSPKEISLKGKLSVAFGARGRGSAIAHFEPHTFTINLTRFARPKQGSAQKKGFDRNALLVAGGGMGSFAHEYGHALDFYGGTYVEKTKGGALSGSNSLRIEPDKKIMAEKSLAGLMEKLLYKIIWKNTTEHSEYYKRLEKANLSEYYFRRNEIFARAFETYVHYKMDKKKYKNIFLAENKYIPRYYLTPAEMKKLEADFDKLISGLKAKL